MLGYNGTVFQNPSLAGSTVIVDESSMIDSLLLAEIVRRNPSRLILVGDYAQLPPVGRGAPFHDLIEFRPDLVSTLTRCYRATEAVFQAANEIRNGGRPPMSATSEGERWMMMNTGKPERTQEQILSWVTSDDSEFDFSKDIIIVARNGESEEEPCTVKGLNKAIVDAISPRDPKVRFVTGDRVINTKNLPDLDCWNGTTGTIHAVDQDGSVWVRTDIPVIDWKKSKSEREPTYTSHVLFARDQRAHLQLAYALTVHKSQGSQMRNVIFAAFNRDTHGLLDRSLLYTAVTRTKAMCCVVGELASVWAAIDRVERKNTVIQQLAEAN